MWSTEGISTEVLSNGTIKCSSTHLTSFTILVSVQGEDFNNGAERLALQIVSYIGCVISILCLILTIIFLLALRYVIQ